MIRRVLIALDDSPTADKALRHIAGIGRGFNLEQIGLINVRPSMHTLAYAYGYSALATVDGTVTQRMADDLRHAATLSKQLLNKARQFVEQQQLEGVEIVCHEKEGPVAKQILEVIRENDYDLLIMGSRGMGRAAGLIMGSVSHAIVTNLPCSMLIVDADDKE